MSADNKIYFYTIDAFEIITNSEGYVSRSASCTALIRNNCPDPRTRPCGDCIYANTDQDILNKFVRSLDPRSSLEFETDSQSKSSVSHVLSDRTEFKLIHKKGDVTVIRKNPPVLVE